MDHTDPSFDLATYVRGEIRAWMGRRDLNYFDVAELVDRDRTWVGNRLSGRVGTTLEDVQVFADGLGIDVRTLMPPQA